MAIDNVGKTTLPEAIEKILAQAILDEAKVEFEKAKNEMVKRLEERMNQIVTGVSLKVSKHVRIYEHGETIVIEIIKRDMEKEVSP